jgi:hypothetical protein
MYQRVRERGYQRKKILQRVDPLLGNDRETNKEITSASSQQIIHKQVHADVTG